MKAILFRYSSWCLSLFCMLSMLSCVELDVIPTDKYTDETYWTSEANASALLMMCGKVYIAALKRRILFWRI